MARLVLTLVLVVVIALAAVAIYVEVAPSGKTTTSSTATSTTLTSSSSSATYAPIVLFSPATVLVAPGQPQNYTTIEVNSPVAGALTGTMSLAVFPPSGISIALNQSTLNLAEAPITVPYTVEANLGVSPGTYQAVLETSHGGTVQNQTLKIEVVQYLVTMLQLAFHPLNLTVPVGANVTWLNLDGMIGCCDPGIHNVDFTSSLHFVSPDISRFQTFSYVFSAPGTFYYYCSIHPFMIAQVVVAQTSG